MQSGPEQRLKDLFIVSYLFSRGIPIETLEVKGSQVVFIITDRRAIREIEDYEKGKALVNPQILKTAIHKVKDMLFSEIRESKKCSGYQRSKR
jgi:hypothetical protein